MSTDSTPGMKLLRQMLHRWIIPFYDQYVDEALGLGDNYWTFWQEVTNQRAYPPLVTAIEEARTRAEAPVRVSSLRIIDAVVWMRRHG